MRCRSKNSFEKILLPSSCAASFDGPTMAQPRSRNASPMPSTSGNSGPTTVRSGSFFSANATSPATSPASIVALGISGDAAVPGSAPDFLYAGALLQLPDERVLASAPANHQNVHESPSGPLTLDASNVRCQPDWHTVSHRAYLPRLDAISSADFRYKELRHAHSAATRKRGGPSLAANLHCSGGHQSCSFPCHAWADRGSKPQERRSSRPHSASRRHASRT